MSCRSPNRETAGLFFADFSYLSSCQAERRDFRPHVEADAEQVAKGAVDVHAPAVAQVYRARHVALVFHRHSERRQEGQPALAAVRVTGQAQADDPVQPARQRLGESIRT